MGQHSLFAGSGWTETPRSKKPEKVTSRESHRLEAVKSAAVQELSPLIDVGPADPLKGLNTAQREAVLIRDGFLLIVAGPGTGKTRTLTHKIAFFIENR